MTSGVSIYAGATPGGMQLLLDEVGGTTYVGKAAPGSTQSSAAWQLRRITVSGGTTAIAFAEGTDRFDKVWADRAAYTYK